MSGRALYFFFNPWTGLIKVGIANNVEERLETLECAAGVRFRVLATLDQSSDLEKPLHLALFATREVGEWFRPSEDLLAIIREPSRNAIIALVQRNQPAVQAHMAEMYAKDEARRNRAIAERAEKRAKKARDAERKRQRELKATEKRQKAKTADRKKRNEELKAWRAKNVVQLREQGLIVNEPFPEAALLDDAERQRKRNQQLIGLSGGVIQ